DSRFSPRGAGVMLPPHARGAPTTTGRRQPRAHRLERPRARRQLPLPTNGQGSLEMVRRPLRLHVPIHRTPLQRTACLAALLLAASCGGSSSSSPSAALSVALADAPIDSVTSFSLGVTAISVTSSAGAVKTLINTPIVVDLATMTNVSQLVDLNLIDP